MCTSQFMISVKTTQDNACDFVNSAGRETGVYDIYVYIMYNIHSCIYVYKHTYTHRYTCAKLKSCCLVTFADLGSFARLRQRVRGHLPPLLRLLAVVPEPSQPALLAGGGGRWAPRPQLGL